MIIISAETRRVINCIVYDIGIKCVDRFPKVGNEYFIPFGKYTVVKKPY